MPYLWVLIFKGGKMKKYGIIYADPPWKYNARVNTNTKFGGGAMGHYNTMTTYDILKLSVKDISDDNCALCLWTTFPRLQDGLFVMWGWGFEYKTVLFNWVKTNKNNNNPFFGIGYYTKSNSEICLLGIKGKMKPVSNKVSSIIISPREEHSKKPDEARKRIVQLFGDLPRIELFARKKTEGWDVWGNEVDSDICLGGLNGNN